MPPRKKQKTDATSKSSGTPADFPGPDLLVRAFNHYHDALLLRSKEYTKTPLELAELDAWLNNGETGLLAKIASSQPVDKADMTSLMKWKLSRGKSRPTLLALIGSNSEALVLESTSTSLEAVRKAENNLESALLALKDACKMKGVGAATASALLTLQSPHLLPFMSDEAASFFAGTIGEIKYTDTFYKKFATAVVHEVLRLNAEAADVDPPMVWDSLKLERALWAIVILQKHGQDELLHPPADPVSGQVASGSSGSLKRTRPSS